MLAQNNPGKAAPGGRCRGRLLTCGALPASGAFTPAPPPPISTAGKQQGWRAKIPEQWRQKGSWRTSYPILPCHLLLDRWGGD